MGHFFAERQLYRTSDACLGGVCACLARRFDFDPLAVRIFAIIISFATLGLGVLAYLFLWASLPREQDGAGLCDVQPEHVESSAYGPLDLTGAGMHDTADAMSGGSMLVRLLVAVCLMLLFLAVALLVEPIVDGSHWWQFWPVGLIIAGLCLMIIPIGSRNNALWHACGIVVTSFAATLLPVSLGVMSASTFSLAIERMWPLALAAVGLVAVGMMRDSAPAAVVGALLLAGFFVMALAFCGIPGDVDQLMLNMPGGGSMRVMMVAPVSL